MDLTISYEFSTALLGINIYRQSTGTTVQVYVKSVDKISSFINMVKDYEPVRLIFDRNVTNTQKELIKRHIAENVTL